MSAITLGDDAGDTTHFGSLDLTGAAVTVTEDSGTVLAGVSASSLDLTSNGNITQTGAVAIGGTTTLDAGGTTAGTNNIMLDNTANAFNSVIITQGGDITLADADSLTLGSVTTGGLLSATVDANNDGTSTLTVSAAISAGTSVTLSGSAALNDIVDINADITAGTSLTMENASSILIDASGTRALTARMAISTLMEPEPSDRSRSAVVGSSIWMPTGTATSSPPASLTLSTHCRRICSSMQKVASTSTRSIWMTVPATGC
ncbi:MAG: hypothetical protein U5O39_19015 [Gammaproteobacteria bacterium]|nr:hypothetical protein [Gammaproteobacteria bacterium]